MPTCTFCGHDNRSDARSCVACGKVFAGGAPRHPEPEPAGAAGAPVSLATLFEADSVRRAARQALGMLVVGAVLAVAVAVAAALDAARALDEIGGGGFLVDPPSLTPRTDLLALAELSVVAGVLVMLGGWAQQVAANRALLQVATPRHTARWALGAWLIPGANVALPGVVIRELWADAAPPGGDVAAPRAVRLWPLVFGVALGARLAGAVYALAASPSLEERSDVVRAAVFLLAPLVLWIAALALTALVVRALTARQVARAAALGAG